MAPPTAGGIIQQERGKGQSPQSPQEQQVPEALPEHPVQEEHTESKQKLVHQILFLKRNLNVTKGRIASMGVVPISTNASLAGRLRYHINNWRVVTGDRWVLDTVQGYSVELISKPHQTNMPRQPYFNQEQDKLISEEIKELLQKGEVTKVENPQRGFYSTLFLVPKKDGGQRPMINLKALNCCVEAHHFKMEGIHTMKELLKPGDWLLSG